MQSEQFEFDKMVQEHDGEDFKNHTKTFLKLTPCEFHKGHKIEVISPATEEEIVDKLIQLGEIYPVSKEELEGAIKNAERCNK